MKKLRASVEYMPELMQWWSTCADCKWVRSFVNSGQATYAADWHDIEVHEVLK